MDESPEQKTAYSEIETTPPPTFSSYEEKGRRRGFVRFLRKWWWLLLIIIGIIVVVVVPPVVLVAIPNYIQRQINKSQLSVDGIAITQTQTSSVWTAINSTIRTSTSTKASIEGFNASLYLEDKLPHTPFAYLQMPETSSKKVQAVNISQHLDLFDAQAYTDFNTWYLLNESFRMTIAGETYVHVSGLKKTKVNYKKTVTLIGLNGFAGLNVTSSSASLTPDSNGDNLHGFVSIPNPSVLTLEIGNATFNTLFNDSSIGLATIPNMYLIPGDNSLPIRANVSQLAVLSAVTSEPYCANGTLPLQFVGESVINHGQYLSYFEQGLSEHKQPVTINATADLDAALGTKLSCNSGFGF